MGLSYYPTVFLCMMDCIENVEKMTVFEGLVLNCLNSGGLFTENYYLEFLNRSNLIISELPFHNFLEIKKYVTDVDDVLQM